jgi:electron transfer flavoprotein-quinone oxidoreductase
MTSGRYAGEAVIEAKKRGDFSQETLSLYDEKIHQSFIRKDLVKYKGMHEFLKEEDPDLLFNRLPQAANQALYELFLVDGVPKGEKQKKMLNYLKEAGGGAWGLAKLGIKGWRAMNG